MNMKYNPEIPRVRYDGYGNREWERLEKDRLGDLLYHVHLDILKRYISDSDNVIELGAGAGRFTKDIVNMSKSLITSDLSPVQIEINKRKMKELGLIDKVKDFMVLDIANLEGISDNTYDAAVCIGGPINYLFDKEETAINEMLRILKPGGKMILGSMSLIGALMYYLNGVMYEKELFGIDATEWIFATGMQDEEHYPVENKHYVHMMKSKELDALFEGKQVKILEKSSAGLFMHSQEETLSKAKEDKAFWELLIRKEIEFTKLPGTLDCGMNIIYVVEKL
jgi:ubiquinone/menaquinone biosynthesis C-methylase UbiE